MFKIYYLNRCLEIYIIFIEGCYLLFMCRFIDYCMFVSLLVGINMRSLYLDEVWRNIFKCFENGNIVLLISKGYRVFVKFFW